jgi:ABC-type polysaccharide/polyol phosphate transport system ATPase subunit
MTDPFDSELPLMQVKSLGKLYARKTSDTRRRMSKMARNAFFNVGKPGTAQISGSEFWAVQDVSFDLKRGEAIGIIGLNGSGKTTLLRILAGQLLPDQGEVMIRGTSAAMIDLQAGFQPKASGRENIYLRAAALGFRRSETAARVQEIIDFSELEHAIDAPLASYSSGMKMRLAFSVMAMVAPEVLIIDEVLAVGDFRFRQKSLAKVREMRAKSAFVFVSHSMGDVARFCDKVMVMHKGKVVFAGEPDSAIAYFQTLEQNTTVAPEKSKSLIPAPVSRPDMISDFEFEWLDASGSEPAAFMEGEAFGLRVSFVLKYTPRNLIVGIPIYDTDGNVLAGLATDADGRKLEAEAGQRVVLEMKASDVVLVPGQYRAAIGITDGTEFMFMAELSDFLVRHAGRKSWGVVSIPFKWNYSVDGVAKSNPLQRTVNSLFSKRADH